MAYAPVVPPPPPERPQLTYSQAVSGTPAPAPAPSADPLEVAYVALLAHFDGTNGSTTLPDSSGEAHTLTANGTAALSTAQSKFGGASLDLSTGANFVTSENTSRFNLTTSGRAVTVSGWVYPKATSASGTQMALASTYKTGVGGWHCGLQSNGSTYSLFFSDGTSADRVFTASIAAGAWSHFEFSGSMSAMLAFVNGSSLVTTWSWGGPFVSGDRLRIGGIDGSTKTANVYLDDLRIIMHGPRHTASFTAPTAAYTDP